MNVTGGSYTTEGTGSPVIYSTADITVRDAQMESTASQGVVVEGQNSVTLNNVTLTASNVKKNSDKSQWYQAVMIYQSMSGDADEGLASFAMNGGTLTNLNGDIFFVNNTTAAIDLTGATIVNEDEEGVFLRAAAAGWGSEGSNGGHVTMTAAQQTIDGDMIVDEVSSLNLYLKESSSFNGAINSDGESGDVYVEIEDGSTWTLTGDSYITSLTCGAGSINLNGYKLYVNGQEYTEGSASEGEAIVVETSSGNSHSGGGRGDGKTPPEKTAAVTVTEARRPRSQAETTAVTATEKHRPRSQAETAAVTVTAVRRPRSQAEMAMPTRPPGSDIISDDISYS